MKLSASLIFVLCSFFEIVTSQTYGTKCEFHDTCEQCLGARFECAWCTDQKYKWRFRCHTRDMLLQYNCAPENIWVNEEKKEILSEDRVSDYKNEDTPGTQVSPQLIQMKIVKSKTQQIKLTYRPARNYPLDLYYLMDLTWTMRDDRETLIEMGAQLSEALRNLTGNYRIGFGSFADKPAMPMIMPHIKDNPCATEHTSCEPTYGFRHRLSMTKNIDYFVQSVTDSHVTANLDNLEGGLDALMQVIVCFDKVGWQEEARKIVLLATDGYMHFAGDGILAGITKRNDRTCHLDDSGEYTGSLHFDYPSLEEIYRELVRRKISVIFAVTSDIVGTYRKLSKLLNGISNVEVLSLDSSNIIELIKTSYETFLKRGKFTDDSPAFIDITYETNCGGQFKDLLQRNYCNDLDIGKEVEFFINITLKSFPEDGIYNRTIRIWEHGLSEYLELQVEIQKPCPCTEGLVTNENTRFQCSEHGSMQCGMCVCDDGWGGLFCSCSLTNETTSLSIEKECRQNQNLSPICSNRGDCACGICECFPGYSGKYCECPSCEGCDLDKADCFCGRCVCKYGWSGNNCNCKSSPDECKAPNGEICSDRGACQCGKCVCEEQYVGRFCEIGWENDNKLCLFYEVCVKCLIQQKLGIYYCDNITKLCSNHKSEVFEYEFVDDVEEGMYTSSADELLSAVGNKCNVRITDKDDIRCDHTFAYNTDDLFRTIIKIKTNDCTPVDTLVVGGLIFSITILLGFMLITMYICFIRVADAREYAKFLKEEKFSVVYNSPIYKNPISKYEVPKLSEDDDLME